MQAALAKSQALSSPLGHAERVVVVMDTSVAPVPLSTGRGWELGLQHCSRAHRCTLERVKVDLGILKCLKFSLKTK